jgi:hypothetical protein
MGAGQFGIMVKGLSSGGAKKKATGVSRGLRGRKSVRVIASSPFRHAQGTATSDGLVRLGLLQWDG